MNRLFPDFVRTPRASIAQVAAIPASNVAMRFSELILHHLFSNDKRKTVQYGNVIIYDKKNFAFLHHLLFRFGPVEPRSTIVAGRISF